jgi:hypothetical protein
MTARATSTRDNPRATAHIQKGTGTAVTGVWTGEVETLTVDNKGDRVAASFSLATWSLNTGRFLVGLRCGGWSTSGSASLLRADWVTVGLTSPKE